MSAEQPQEAPPPYDDSAAEKGAPSSGGGGGGGVAGLTLNIDYVKSIPGILKIAQFVCICLLHSVSQFHNHAQ